MPGEGGLTPQQRAARVARASAFGDEQMWPGFTGDPKRDAIVAAMMRQRQMRQNTT
jgi:hypothetical protein